MPASQTITAFYSFSPNTTIYSAQVNNNFDLMRGHWLPIDGSTTAFANNAYDLGSSSFGWKGLYFGSSATINVINASLTTFTFPSSSGQLSVSRTPTIQRFTSGSGTYTTPTGCKYIVVEVVGGGAGGAGGGTANSSSTGGNGGSSTFGTSLLTAPGGQGALWSGNPNVATAPTVNSPAITILTITGIAGGGTFYIASSGISPHGGAGGSNPLGAGGFGRGAGAGADGYGFGAGAAGGGSGGGANAYTGAGGSSGSYLKAIIPEASLSSTYSYAVGSGGSAGGAGTSGFAGGTGAGGAIIVTEYY